MRIAFWWWILNPAFASLIPKQAEMILKLQELLKWINLLIAGCARLNKVKARSSQTTFSRTIKILVTSVTSSTVADLVSYTPLTLLAHTNTNIALTHWRRFPQTFSILELWIGQLDKYWICEHFQNYTQQDVEQFCSFADIPDTRIREKKIPKIY